MEQDTDDMPIEQNPIIELQFEQRYHQNRLQLNAIDALLHRLTDDAVLKWLNGGPRPRNAVPLSLGNRPYLTRGAARSMEAGESSRARRGLQWYGGLDPASSVAIDLDSDSIRNFCMMFRKLYKKGRRLWTQ